jgi:hypothetical protein
MTTATAWMGWIDGVDLVALTAPGLPMPNLILHVARLVHTPVGSAPAGMVLWQPDPAGAPAVVGFVCPDPTVGAYFGPSIFAGTPFAQAPVLTAGIDIRTGPGWASSDITVAGHRFTVRLEGLSAVEPVQRAPGPMTPFTQQGGEAAAARVAVTIDGTAVPVIVPPVGISGGPAAVWAPFGGYLR